MDKQVAEVKEKATLKKFKALPSGEPDTSNGPSEEMVYEGNKLVKHVKIMRVGHKTIEVDMLDKEKINGTD